MLTLYYWCQEDNPTYSSGHCDELAILSALKQGEGSRQIIFLGERLQSKSLPFKCVQCMSTYCEELHEALLC